MSTAGDELCAGTVTALRGPLGGTMLSLALAFFAGIVTIAAPCTLPVLPILLGASVGRATGARPVFIALGFVVSFGTVALALNAITEAIGFDPVVLRNGAALILVVFGLLMIWPSLFEALLTKLRSVIPAFDIAPAAAAGHDNLSGFVLGTALGLVWTPCAGPILGAILTLVARSKDFAWASLQLLIYAVGAAVPMLAIAYGGQALTASTKRFARYAPRLQQAFGVIVIAFAAATYMQYDTEVVAWLTKFYPVGFISL